MCYTDDDITIKLPVTLRIQLLLRLVFTPSEEGVSQCTRDSYQASHWSMCAVLASDWPRAERGKCDGHGVELRL